MCLDDEEEEEEDGKRMWWQPECLARLARVWSQACKFSGPVRSTEDISLNVNIPR